MFNIAVVTWKNVYQGSWWSFMQCKSRIILVKEIDLNPVCIQPCLPRPCPFYSRKKWWSSKCLQKLSVTWGQIGCHCHQNRSFGSSTHIMALQMWIQKQEEPCIFWPLPQIGLHAWWWQRKDPAALVSQNGGGLWSTAGGWCGWHLIETWPVAIPSGAR